MKDFKGYKKGVNLGGWLSQCKHTYEHYDSFITEADIEKIASWHTDHVRLPVDYNLLEDESALAITEKQYREDYGWTDEMFEMWYKVREMTDENPVVSLHMGLPTDVAAIVDDGIKQASFNGTDWAVTRESMSELTQQTVDELNAKIEEKF